MIKVLREGLPTDRTPSLTEVTINLLSDLWWLVENGAFILSLRTKRRSPTAPADRGDLLAA
jgi:hypothetical protein